MKQPKTCLFTPCFLDGADPSGSDRFERNIKYLDYYRPLKEELGFDRFVMADNASSPEKLQALGGEIMIETEPHGLLGRIADGICGDLTVISYQERLVSGGGLFYPYCWRAVYAIRHAFDSLGYNKVILVDSDSFILSKRLAGYIKQCNSGWETFWCKKWQFPTAELHVLNRDALPVFREFIKTPYMERNGTLMETELPYRLAACAHELDTDRYGEDRIPQRPGMDFYSQCPTNIEMRFES